MKKYQPESCSAVGHESKFYEEEVGYKVIYNNSCIALELPKGNLGLFGLHSSVGRTMCGASFVVPARSIGVQVWFFIFWYLFSLDRLGAEFRTY